MLSLSFTFPLLLAATTANAFFDASENVHRVALINQRSPFSSGDDALGVIARQLNGTGSGGGSCSGFQTECSAAQGGGCCPFMQPCCGDGCCPKYYSCAIDEHLEKPCKCYGSLCPDDDDDDDSSSGSGSGPVSGDDDSDDSSGSGSGSFSGGSFSGDDDDNAGGRLASFGVGATILVAGLVAVAAL